MVRRFPRVTIKVTPRVEGEILKYVSPRPHLAFFALRLTRMERLLTTDLLLRTTGLGRHFLERTGGLIAPFVSSVRLGDGAIFVRVGGVRFGSISTLASLDNERSRGAGL